MPLPLFFIVPAVVAGAAGVGKTVKAGIDNSKAKEIINTSNDMIDRQANKLEKLRKSVGVSLEELGSLKATVISKSIIPFLEDFRKIKNVNFEESKKLNEFGNVHIDEHSFEELGELNNMVAAFSTGALAGITGGAAVAFGAYSAATSLATASTGTAIATLHGAAATNATLAFFGGGAKIAGGLGMSAGMGVLGGLVAGPALLVMGLISGAKADKNLEEALASKAKAEKICKQLSAGQEQCKIIMRRVYMIYALLARLDAYYLPLIYKAKQIIESEGESFQKYEDSSKETIMMAVSTTLSIKAVLDTPILTEEGTVTKESAEVLDTIK